MKQKRVKANQKKLKLIETFKKTFGIFILVKKIIKKRILVKIILKHVFFKTILIENTFLNKFANLLDLKLLKVESCQINNNIIIKLKKEY